jgi:DnaJ-class molecular chaperone
MSDVDYYAILGVGPEAESDEIEDAYQRAVTRVRRDEPGRARTLAEARAVLLDPTTRAEYDARCVGPAVIEETVAAIMEAHQRRVDVRRFVRARWDLFLAALRTRQGARPPSS